MARRCHHIMAVPKGLIGLRFRGCAAPPRTRRQGAPALAGQGRSASLASCLPILAPDLGPAENPGR